MVSSNNRLKTLNNIQAFRIITNAIDNNPESIGVVINVPEDSDIHTTNSPEEASVDVGLKEKDGLSLVFSFFAIIKFTNEDDDDSCFNRIYHLSVKEIETPDGVKVYTIDKFGRRKKQEKVTLQTYELKPEIKKIFDILNQRSKNNDSDVTTTYDVSFDTIPFHQS